MSEKDKAPAEAPVETADEAFAGFGGSGGWALQPFAPAMIEAHLRQHGLKFYRGDDQSFLFEMETPHGYDLRVHIACEGTSNQVCAVRVSANAEVPRASWGRAAFACNEWARLKRWPRAFLDIEDATASASAELSADGHHDFEHGATQQQVNLFLNQVIAAAIEFFAWAKTEKKLF